MLALSSLHSPRGIGDFGESALEWLRFLRDAGQKYWQILPLGPTGWGDSPYQSFSAFAISPYYISLDDLIRRKLLWERVASYKIWGSSAALTDYYTLYRRRWRYLRLASFSFTVSASDESRKDFERFREENSFWLEDFALFTAIKKKLRGKAWTEWDEDLRRREPAAMKAARDKLSEETLNHSIIQYFAFEQWRGLREAARALGVAIIGDMPMYVAADSADAWACGRLFQLDEDQRPLRVAGCPPDPFSAKGQLWGNPLYRWDRMEEEGFAWWIARLRAAFGLYDALRIDHFRGFESYFSIDPKARDASGGEWVKGPGLAFIRAIHAALPGANIIAEDLGYLTPEVKALLRASGYPGMKVLQFAFDSREPGEYAPHTYERNSVVYTGTHDNPTARGWFACASGEDAAFARDFLGARGAVGGGQAMIRCALASAPNTAIIPMQDYLGLNNRARMNRPSTVGGSNWRWRMTEPQFKRAIEGGLAERMRRLAEVYGRSE